MTAAPLTPEFWAKVIVPSADACWTWTGCKTKGYGRFRYAGRMWRAHRLVYVHTIGDVPEGMTLDHVCNQRDCVNPSHLRPASIRENVLRGDGPTAQNLAKQECDNGHSLMDPRNVRIEHGRRQCRACGRIRQSRYMEAIRG